MLDLTDLGGLLVRVVSEDDGYCDLSYDLRPGRLKRVS